MKALILPALGDSLVYDDFSLPRPTSGQVLVKVRAAALNHRDVWITKGKYPGLKFPAIMGSDVAGISEGRDVLLNPSIGWGDNPDYPDRNYHILGMPSYGGFAEEIVVPQELVYDKPPHLSFPEAAALPLAGLTAYRALFTKGRIKSGEKVMITGIGGGVALMAFQFALAMGAEVYVSSGSPEKIAKAHEMGAAGGVNYKEDDWANQLKEMAKGFDIVIDSAGGEGFSQLVKLANQGGRLVMYGGTTGNIPKISPQTIFWRQLSILGTSMGHPREFGNMLAFVREKAIIPVVDSRYSLANGAEAFARMDQGLQFGKIIIEP